jgi:hypothetical protein
VLVVGSSEAVKDFQREYRGTATPGATGTDVVSCASQLEGLDVRLTIDAGQAGEAVAQTELSFKVPSAVASELDFTGAVGAEQTFRVRLGPGDAFKFHEYELGVDDAKEPSTCHLSLRQIDDHSMTGTVVCRNLVASYSSLDANGAGGDAGGERGSASATIDFSCPLRILSAPPGSAGSASFGGFSSGGNSALGGSTSAGSAGTAGSSGSGGAGGSGMPQQTCTGSATPCSLRGSATCSSGLGCTYAGTCTGLATSCYAQFGSFSCVDQEGCVWDSSLDECEGSAWGCSLFHNSTSCILQEGCDWTSDCTGVAATCSSLDEVECGLQPGCSWQ